MAIQIKVETNRFFDDLIVKFGGFSNILIPQIQKGLLQYGYKVEGESKRETPVDTGQLRSTIQTNPSIQSRGLTVRVAPHKAYASWIHEGRRIDPRFGLVTLKGRGVARTPAGGKPYMKIGAEKSEDYGRRIMRESVQSAINQLK